MPNTYQVVVHRRLYVSLDLVADTKDEAEKLARKQIEAEFGHIQEWVDYEPLEIEYKVHEGDPM